MENQLKVFNNSEFGSVRTILVNDEPYFVGKDVADILGYSNTSDALIKRVDEEDKLTSQIATSGQNREMTIINESGLYSLILSSKLPKAKSFKRWVTSEVLPAIRQNGTYSRPMSQAEILAQSAQLLVEMEKRVNEVQTVAEKASIKIDNAITAFTAPVSDDWKEETNKKINQMCMLNGLPYQSFKGDLYAELESIARCDLTARQRNLRERIKMSGATYKERQAITKIDVITRDDKLKAIFDGIVRKYQLKYADNVKG